MLCVCVASRDSLARYTVMEDERRGILRADALGENALTYADGCITVPDALTVTSDGAPSPRRISAAGDANYTLTGSGETHLLMLRTVANGEAHMALYLPGERARVGRAGDNDIVYRDGFLSSSHGAFYLADDRTPRYADTSTNGTYINGRRVRGKNVALREGDALVFPPLLTIVYTQGRLAVGDMGGRIACKLPPAPVGDEDDVLVRVTSLRTNRLYHLRADRRPRSVEGFIQRAISQLPEGERATFSMPCVLLDAQTRATLDDSRALAQCLANGRRAFLIG